MTKPKQDPLLAALIAKLPARAEQWPLVERVAWLRMMAMAFDVVYGGSGEVQIVLSGSGEPVAACAAHEAARALPPVQSDAASAVAPPRFCVDRDGFAMGDGRPIAIEDLQPGATLWDERTGVECGDLAAILWRDIGTTRRGLPAGVTLLPVSPAS